MWSGATWNDDAAIFNTAMMKMAYPCMHDYVEGFLGASTGFKDRILVLCDDF